MGDSHPPDWLVEPLERVADVQTGLAKGRRQLADPVELPYLRVANVQDGYLDLSEVKTISVERDRIDRYRLRPGDVLLTEGGDLDKLGRGTVWRGELKICLHQNHVFVVRPNPNEVLSLFLSALTASDYGKRYFLGCAKQTTNLASINSRQLKAFPVLVPPLPEQRKIATILSSVDEAIEKTQAVIDRAQVVKKGLMQELLTKGLPGRHKTFKQTENGRIPESWETKRTIDLLRTKPKNGKSPKASTVPPGIPTFSIAAVRNGVVNVLGNLKYANVHRDQVSRFEIAAGDVLIVRGNANPELVGRCGMVTAFPDGCIYPDILMRAVPNEKLHPRYLVRCGTRMSFTIRCSIGQKRRMGPIR